MSTKRDAIPVDSKTGAIVDVLLQETSTPATPPHGQQRLFVDGADHLLKVVDDAGVVTEAGGGGGGEVLMQDGVSAPPVPLETEDRTDWLWEG